MDAHSGGLCICDKSHNDKVIPHEQTYYRDLEEREIVVTDTDVKKQQNDVNGEELSGGDGETNSDWSSLQSHLLTLLVLQLNLIMTLYKLLLLKLYLLLLLLV